MTILSSAQTPTAYNHGTPGSDADQDLPDQAGPVHDGDVPQEDYNADLIRVETHSHASMLPKTYKFLEFDCDHKPMYMPPLNTCPCALYHSCLDYKFAELCLQASLNPKHIARFIELMNQCKNGKDCNELLEEFTFETYTDLQKSWKNGYEKLTPISI